MTRDDLKAAVSSALSHHGGEATIVEVARFIWNNHEADLKSSGDLFYTWQYEMRWAAQKLRDEKALILGRRGNKNTWRKI